jgi:hypothetical protein
VVQAAIDAIAANVRVRGMTERDTGFTEILLSGPEENAIAAGRWGAGAFNSTVDSEGSTVDSAVRGTAPGRGSSIGDTVTSRERFKKLSRRARTGVDRFWYWTYRP